MHAVDALSYLPTLNRGREIKSWLGEKVGRAKIQNFEYLENEMNLLDEINILFFKVFEGVSFGQKIKKIVHTSLNVLGFWDFSEKRLKLSETTTPSHTFCSQYTFFSLCVTRFRPQASHLLIFWRVLGLRVNE